MEVSLSERRERILYEGKHLSLKQKGSWEYVERRWKAGGVLVVAVTSDQMLLLVEEYRPPVDSRVISLPAGLVGDGPGPEAPIVAAARELREETGYEATKLDFLGSGPSSPGLACESVSFFLAHEAWRVGPPTAEEDITLHAVPLSEIWAWARLREREGALIHPLLWAGLYLAFPPHAPGD
jgi:ADP-ribose pyrophosphatase